MKLKPTALISFFVLASVIVLTLVLLAQRPVPHPVDWLRIVPGSMLVNRTNAQGVATAIASLTLSNAGPRKLKFAFSDDLRWESGNLHGDGGLPSGLFYLESSAKTNLSIPTTGNLAPKTAATIVWGISWWEERTGLRRFWSELSARLPIALYHVPQMMSGIVRPPKAEVDPDVYFRLRYGLIQRAAESNAEPRRATDASRSFGSETNRAIRIP